MAVSTAMDGLYSKSTHAKLTVLFILPLLIFLLVSAVQIRQSMKQTQEIANLEKLVELAIHISALIHETQKERGSTGIYLSSKGEHFSDELLQQHRQTDKYQKKLQLYLTAFNSNIHSREFNRSLQNALTQTKNLNKIRQQILLRQIEAGHAIESYTKLNRAFLDTVNSMIFESSNADLTRAIIAYSAFLQGKEVAGLERAVLGRAFTQNHFSEGMYRRFVELVTEQNTFQLSFFRLTDTRLAEQFSIFRAAGDYKNVQRYRDIAHLHAIHGGFNISAEHWFGLITTKIDQLKAMEDIITDDLAAKSYKLKNASRQAQIRWQALIIITTLAALIFGIWMVRNIDRSFNRRLEEYRLLFENSSAGMAVLNSDNQRFLFCNTTFANMLGYKKQEIKRLRTIDIHPEESSDKVLTSFQQSLGKEINSTHEIPFKRKDGSIFYAQINAFPIIIEEKHYIANSIKDITERREAEHKNKQLLQQNRQLAQRNYTMQETERREIAAELHDQLGQSMVGIMMQADHIHRHISDHNEAVAAASNIAKTIRSLINDTRNLTNKLRPVTLDQLGLVDALSELIDSWQQYHHECHFQLDIINNIPELSDQPSICVYRIVQEGLTNISKHAKAKNVKVSLSFDSKLATPHSKILTLTIVDDGIGMREDIHGKWGMGVINMRERVQSLGGYFELGSEANKGVSITVCIPAVGEDQGNTSL